MVRLICIDTMNLGLLKTLSTHKKAEDEIVAYQITKKRAMEEIQKIHDMLLDLNDEKAKIFKAHLDIVDDVAIDEEIAMHIKDSHYTYTYAIHLVYDMFIEMFSQVEDELIQERVADLKDVKLRLLRISDGVEESNLATFNEDKIVIANDLYPSDTATLNRRFVKGIITEVGGKTSHTAIIAKSYEIPAILGVSDAMIDIKDNDVIIVDAIKDIIVINPDESTLNTYRLIQQENLDQKEKNKKIFK